MYIDYRKRITLLPTRSLHSVKKVLLNCKDNYDTVKTLTEIYA